MVLVALGTVLGCSAADLAARQTVSLLARTAPAMAEESDVELVLRAAPAGIKQLEGFWLITGDRRLAATLAEASCGYGGLVADAWEEADLAGDPAGEAEALRAHARASLARCAAWAVHLLGARGDGLLEAPAADAAARLAGATRADAPSLYWLALAGASILGLDPGDLRVVALEPRLRAILERVIELDPDHALGQAEMLLGILWSSRSAAVGGDPARGARHFARARAVTDGALLLPAVMEARIWAVTTRDAARFDALLREVVRTSPAVLPGQRLANEVAYRKARRYQRARAAWF